MAHIPSNDIHNSDFIPKTTAMTLYNQINDRLDVEFSFIPTWNDLNYNAAVC